MTKNLGKVSQLYEDDIQSKIFKIYKSESFEINTLYYSRKIKELIKNFNQNIKPIKKEDICSEKTVLLISYADNLRIKGEKNTLNIFSNFFKKKTQKKFQLYSFSSLFSIEQR